MAIKIQEAARGNSGTTAGPVKTPAPDEVTNVRSSHPSYGMNNYPGASSVDPGNRVLSPLGANLESSVDDDGVLQHVIEKGTARNDDEITSQLRDIPRTFPDHPHMTDQNANPATIPASIPGASQLGRNGSAVADELSAKQHGKK